MSLTLITRAIGFRGFIAIGFAAAFALMWWRAGVWQERAEEQAQAAANERAAHSVTKASLDKLEQRLAVFIADGERRTKAGEDALRRQQERSAALDGQIARLRAARPTPAEIERCETPSAVRGLEGL